MTNINLTAVLPDRDLTAPERANVSKTVTYTWNVRITRGGNIRISRDGGTRIAHGTDSATTLYPVLLTAVLQDRDLTAPERY